MVDETTQTEPAPEPIYEPNPVPVSPDDPTAETPIPPVESIPTLEPPKPTEVSPGPESVIMDKDQNPANEPLEQSATEKVDLYMNSQTCLFVSKE